VEYAYRGTQTHCGPRIWASPPPLVAGDLLLVPTQESAPPPQFATLHALCLVNENTRWQSFFEHATVSSQGSFG